MVIVAINAFPNDTVEELAFIRSFALENGAVDCEISNAYAEGGKGARTLAERIVKA